MRRYGVATLVCALGAGGCGGGSPRAFRLPAADRPIPAGHGPAFRLRAVSPSVARGAPIGGLRCRRAHPRSFGAHLELYARGLVLPVPAGIGVAPPQRRRGVYVLGGACSYAVRTYEPTGVVLVDTGPTPTLGTLFAVWGQPLSSTSLAGFRGRVLAFLNGRPVRGSAAAIRLRRHAEIVLEVDGAVTPHARYAFPPGL